MENKEDFQNLTINLYYLNNTIKDYELPLNLNELRIKVKKLFHIKNKTNEEILFLYNITKEVKGDEEEEDEENKKKEVTVEVKTDDDYILLLKRIKSDELKNDTIFVETDKCIGISSKNPETFEEEIECVIKNELKLAGERIKKYLSGLNKCYPTTKNPEQNQCNTCNKIISGKIFRTIVEQDEKNYCEKCSLLYPKPLFIIN